MMKLRIMSGKKSTVRILLCGIAIFVILYGVYYPVIGAEISIVDDQDALSGILTSDTKIGDMFFPRAHQGGYYRPMIGLSYLYDKEMWYLDSDVMHQENLLCHIVNAILLFFLARLVLSKSKEPSRSILATGAALVFGLHPVTTESVAWISGRTDLIATAFVLASALFIAQYRNTGRRSYQLASFLVLVPGMLAKEVAFGFLPILMLLGWQRDIGQISSGKSNRFAAILAAAGAVISLLLSLFTFNHWLVVFVAVVFAVVMSASIKRGNILASLAVPIARSTVVFGFVAGLFFIVRRAAFSSDIPKLSQTISLIFYDMNSTLHVFLGAAGFYLKKFIMPLPLNFYIKEIDPLYSLPGIVVLFAVLFCLYRRSEAGLWFLAGVAMFLPALLFAFGTIAWTAYAERYIYTTTAFWGLCVMLLVRAFIESNTLPNAKKVSCSLITIALLFFGWISHARAVTWRTNVALMRDTVELSPDRKVVRGLYMTSLIKAGRLKEAKEQYFKARSLYSFGYDPRYELEMAKILMKEGNNADAEGYLREALKRSKGESANVYEYYAGFLSSRMAEADSSESRSILAHRALENLEKLFKLTANPAVRYRMGQVALADRQRDLAVTYFTDASRLLPKGSEKQRRARLLADKLTIQTGKTLPID
jgi:protein O-mannosyl-transferase